jgi:hypothetical protein
LDYYQENHFLSDYYHQKKLEKEKKQQEKIQNELEKKKKQQERIKYNQLEKEKKKQEIIQSNELYQNKKFLKSQNKKKIDEKIKELKHKKNKIQKKINSLKAIKITDEIDFENMIEDSLDADSSNDERMNVLRTKRMIDDVETTVEKKNYDPLVINLNFERLEQNSKFFSDQKIHLHPIQKHLNLYFDHPSLWPHEQDLLFELYDFIRSKEKNTIFDFQRRFSDSYLEFELFFKDKNLGPKLKFSTIFVGLICIAITNSFTKSLENVKRIEDNIMVADEPVNLMQLIPKRVEDIERLGQK